MNSFRQEFQENKLSMNDINKLWSDCVPNKAANGTGILEGSPFFW